MRKTVVLFVAILLFAAVSAAQYPMPWCGCHSLEYYPAGPTLPESFAGETASGIYPENWVYMEELCIDIGDLPYSVPNFGWHCRFADPPHQMYGNIYATPLGMSVKLFDLTCCDYIVNPAEPLFSNDGITLVWSQSMEAYVGNFGDRRYVAQVNRGPHLYEQVVYLYEGRFNSSTGVMNAYGKYMFHLYSPTNKTPQAEAIASVD